ncbi:MAG: hypothetical protein KF805_03660 [Phycisphaeraceae bacterium]|nr:hypothetical protein [Phycisphaeraceae bacterium]
MSSPSGQNSRSLAQLQRLPVDTKVALLVEALPVAAPSEAAQLGFALVECAAEYSVKPASGSLVQRAIRAFFDAISASRKSETEDALGAVVRSWAFLPTEVRTLASAAGKGRWTSVTGTLATDQNASTRRSVAELARGAGDASLAPIVCELLGDQDQEVASAAEAAICFLALVASDPSLAAWSDHANVVQHEEAGRVRAQWAEIDRERVRTEVAAAVRALSIHRREGVLWAALLLLEPSVIHGFAGGGQLARWINDREQSSHAFLRGLLRRDTSPLSRLRAWQWLGTTAVSGAAADRVVAARTLDEHEALLSSWHLMHNPSRLAKLRQAERGAKAPAKAGLLPPPEIAERLSVDGRVGLASLARGLGAAPGARDGVCEALLSDREPVVRLAATAACSSRMLGDFCFDSAPAVARSAALRLSLAAIPDASLSPGSERVEQERARVRTLLRSPHEQVRNLAASDMELLCESGESGAASRVAFRRALEADRPWVFERLRAMLAESEEARSFALQMARKLGIVIELRDPVLAEIRRLMREPSPSHVPARSLATAVAALREIPGPEPLRLLRESASSSDQRVRANALDALVIRAREGIDENARDLTSRLLEFKEDAWHRVRGSAVRGLELLGGPAGAAGPEHETVVGEQLLKMLEDSRPLHRLAGAWVADRTLPGVRGRSLRELKLWPAMVAKLRSLALTDLESRVRVRCRLALARAGEAPVRGDERSALTGSAA